MSDDSIPIIGKLQGVQVTNLALMNASVPDLLAEIERKGVDIPQTTFQLVQTIAAQRAARWNTPFTKLERAAEVCGEAGELLNAVKKLRRKELGVVGNKPGQRTDDELREMIAYEAGDVFVTVFNLLNDCGIDAWYALQLAFNTKSDELGFPEKL